MAIFVKKALHVLRSRIQSLVQILLPCLCVVAAYKWNSKTEGGYFLAAFDLSMYPSSVVTYLAASDDAVTQEIAKQYASQFDSSTTVKKLDPNDGNMSAQLAKRLPLVSDEYIIGAEFLGAPGGVLQARAFYNGHTSHGMNIALQYLLNSLVKYYVQGHTTTGGLTWFEVLRGSVADTKCLPTGSTLSILIPLGMSVVMPMFAHFIAKERLVGALHMQLVSGVHPVVFWLSNLSFDFLVYFISTGLVVIAFATHKEPAYVEGGRLGLVLLVFLLYGWSFLNFIYLIHFPSATTCFVYIVFSGVHLSKSMMTSHCSPPVGEDYERDLIFMAIMPTYCLSRSLYGISEVCNCKEPVDHLDRKWPGIGREVACMAIQGGLFLLLTLMYEWGRLRNANVQGGVERLVHRSGTVTNEDSDVAEERRRLNASPASELAKHDSLLLINLFKRFGTLVAVDRVCVGVPEQECFGLLGQNGAGKTTIFKILTGEALLTSGNVYVKGHDLGQLVQRDMGYCPQFDAIHELMTARETLTMYARIRGLQSADIGRVVNHLIDSLRLRPWADNLAGTYSGGNRRKLSTAIALVGHPHFILLDEPSSGMDADAKRVLWKVLSDVRASGRTLVLASHSMEECEALCTKVVIMVNGSFVCLGSPQHLKTKFAQGYTLIAKMELGEDGTYSPHMPLLLFINSHYPDAYVFDEHDGYVHIQVPDPDVRQADLFELMEKAVRESTSMHVQEYNLQQTSLEQVFLLFTRKQLAPTTLPSMPTTS